MADGKIRISIGATADRSIEIVFGSFEKRALKCRDTILKAFGAANPTRAGMAQMGDAGEKAFTKIEKAAEKSAKKVQSEQDKAAKAAARSAEATTRAIERQLALQTKARERALAAQGRAEAREAKRREKEAERDAKREANRQVGIRETFASRTSQRATRFLFPPPMGILGAARRVGGDILRGAGVDLSVAGGVSRSIELQSGAVGLSNQERIANGSTRGAAYYEGVARNVGDSRSVDPNKVLDLIRNFTGKTGNFDASAQLANPLASLSTASGADLTEMGDAAGYVYNQLKNLPDAGQRTIAVMRGIVGQTAVGAVEMKDYATQMGRIAANANRFEGGIDTNIMKLSALAQLSIESGGATSAADAARAVGSFANTFGKGARIKAFKGAGVELFADKEQTIMRDPFAIVKDSFRNTKGNIPQLADMFADTLGRKPVMALGAAYKGAGGGEAGIAAIDAALGRYMHAQLSPETEKKNNEDYAASTAAKAQRFQNNLDKIVASAADKLVPAMEELAPMALTAARALGGIAKFAAENPVKAVVAALVLAIGRAGLESALRAAIESRIMGSGSGLLPGRGLDAAGNPLAAATGGVWATRAGIGLQALAAGALGATAGGAIGSLVGGDRGGQAGAWVGGGAGFGGRLAGPAGAFAGAALGAAGDQAQELLKNTEGWGGLGALVTGGFSGLDDYQNKQAKQRRLVEDAGGPGAAAAPNQQPFDSSQFSRGVADGISARTLNVKVTNAADFANSSAQPPRVPSAGRSR